MVLLLLEALLALCLLLFIVWWTMFSGRKKGELPEEAMERTDDVAAKEPPQGPRS
jgi:cbb3-type cytochrome oxidase subunit 3